MAGAWIRGLLPNAAGNSTGNVPMRIDGAAAVGLCIFAGMALLLLCAALCSRRQR